MENRSVARLAVPVGVVGIVMMLVVPLPPALLDVLIVVNITGSLVVLLTAMYVRKPLDFSVFPSLILVLTLFRLGINVASTRLVLRDGYAGDVIDAFGHFVVGGSLVIGLVIFLILVVIQFVVITSGAGRVAEVGARFTLDAMPGKQMAIDADLNSGLIDEESARRRRAEISAEADFYGAMDGGSKFVKGDAVAGIVITVINLVGGFAVGMLQMGMSAGEAIERFSLLTIGDGLVTQIPALLLSVATGIVVTRATAEGDMGTAAATQLTQSRTALTVAGTAAVALALLPGMPKVPFLLVGTVLLIGAQRVGARDKAEAQAAAAPEATEVTAPVGDTPEQLIEQMRVHTLEILLAPDLVDLVGAGPDRDLLARVRALRRKVALDLGIVVPPVRTRDSVDLPPSTYVVRVAGVEVGRGQAPPGRVLALGDDLAALPGATVSEPVFGLPGKWVPAELRHTAEISGATVVDRVSVLVTHLSALVQEHAARLLGREDVRVLTEGLKQVNPSVVEELVPSLLSLGEVQRVLQGLLAEQVAIRDLGRVYEALTLRARVSTDPEGLVEAARVALGPALAAPYVQDGTLRVVTLEPMLEHQLAESVRPGEQGSQLLVEPQRLDALLTQLRAAVARAEAEGRGVVLACSPAIRPALRRLVALADPRLPVLSYTEVTAAGVRVDAVGVVNGDHAIAA
ncbi:flagellar biosynthesis protein FlhA [Cellulomonas wangsupingiae]|uniref:Flagellar biosynthesis protein FlhA n=1 Tax=Cellulomonas wangsupingiae TaxID=2968085 RepID=A0ABY5K6E9_9CELL|nr:flagellar biosynthesis protein FlhA [Cellulomonas wangsupingiae]MCC2334170.1 flagellar biosynthesis protein FlhA [Cellulomonas wangsupingiae]UUI65849.1 flagellar biosynthesis protein FlhA [Cellulomonas wangsupingiae]